MILSNLCSFHAMQILQNATALPAYIYRETNNKARANRKRHEISKQYCLKKKALAKQPPQKQRNHTPQPEAHQRNAAQYDNQDFIPAPFPEKRTPVTIDSLAIHKPNTPLTARPSQPNPTGNKYTKPQHPTQKDSSIANKWLEAKPKQKTRKHHASYTPLRKTAAKSQTKTRNTNPPVSTANQPKKFVWKPGRGAVEKIDKYSGEIFHLVESV